MRIKIIMMVFLALLFLFSGCTGTGSNHGNTINTDAKENEAQTTDASSELPDASVQPPNDTSVATPEVTESPSEVRGNTVGNIVNFGFAAQEGDWIYYSLGEGRGIFKMRADGSQKTQISDSWADYLNVTDGWIYYSNVDGIFKIRTDSSERTKLCDDFANSINVVGGWVYYGTPPYEGDIYKIRTDGSEKTKISDDCGYYLNVVDGWIYYGFNEVPWSEDQDDRGLYKMRADGSEKIRLYDDWGGYINVVDGWIYYCDDSGVYKLRVDGSDLSRLSDKSVSCLNVVDGWMYFVEGEYGGPIYKMRTDGTELSQLCNDYAVRINIIGGWIFYYNDSDNEESNPDLGYFIMKTDGSEYQRLD